MVQTVFAEKQSFKRVKTTLLMLSYIWKSVKHQKNHCLITIIVAESEGDMPATLVCEPIVACFNNPQCNNPSEDDNEWLINDNVFFDYPTSVELFEPVANSFLHLSLIHI